MDLRKLGRTELVLAVAGIVLFIVGFFPWYSVSFGGGVLGGSYSASVNAWSYPSGFEDWFPMLLLLAYAVVLALPAFGVAVNIPLLSTPTNRAFVGLVLSAFALLLFAIQGLTYPSLGGAGGASWGYFAGLIVVIAAGVQSYLGFTQSGGSLANVGAAFKARTQAVQQPPQQPGQPPYGQPQAPYGAAPQQQPTYGQQPAYGQQPPAAPQGQQNPQQPYQNPQQPQQPYEGQQYGGSGQQQPPTPPYSGS